MPDLVLEGAITVLVAAACDNPEGTTSYTPDPSWSATVSIRRVNGMAANRTVTGAGLTPLTFGKGDELAVLSGAVSIYVPKDTYYLKFIFRAGGIFSTSFSPHFALSYPDAYGGCTTVSQNISGYAGR